MGHIPTHTPRINPADLPIQPMATHRTLRHNPRGLEDRLLIPHHPSVLETRPSLLPILRTLLQRLTMVSTRMQCPMDRRIPFLLAEMAHSIPTTCLMLASTRLLLDLTGHLIRTRSEDLHIKHQALLSPHQPILQLPRPRSVINPRLGDPHPAHLLPCHNGHQTIATALRALRPRLNLIPSIRLDPVLLGMPSTLLTR